MAKLQVLISTLGEEGLERLSGRSLPHLPEVEYLVSCQMPGGGTPCLPRPLVRPDVRVTFSPTKGLTINRNILLRLASAPYCLIADDDLDFIPEGLLETIRIFEADPSLAFAAMQFCDENGKPAKRYPTSSFSLTTLPKGYYITSMELAFRRESIVGNGIFFNEKFGVGTSRYLCGEEDLWLHDVLAHKLEARYFPVALTIHHGQTTGVRNAANPGVLRAQGAVIPHLYTATGLLRVVLKAWRTSRGAGVSFSRCLLPALQGWKDNILHAQTLFRTPR